MRQRWNRSRDVAHDELDQPMYGRDFGRRPRPGGHRRLRPADLREAGLDREDRGQWSGRPWRPFGPEGWRRGRVSGGYGSQYDAWRSGAGFPPAGFGFGADEWPRGGFDDSDWQVTRPARGRAASARDGDRADYRGRGPRGYRRSDDRVREEVCERLTDDRLVDASDVEVRVQDGEVTLTGSVSSRDQKRHAEDCVLRIPGVDDVINQLRVQPAERDDHRRKVMAR
jgi:hypothetical protein